MTARAARIVVSLALGAISARAVAAEPWFRDVTAERGIDFRHEDGRSGEKYYPETTASGGGFLDADGDGDLDIYLINGTETPGRKLDPMPRSALYENRDGRFVDVTAKAGVGGPGFGMGLCAGDVDGDGRLDFLVTHYGPDRLYRARGDGTFEEMAGRAGVADPRWSSSCAFGDVDSDGDLDLYVAHYVDFAFDRNPVCGAPERGRRYCLPEAFVGVADSLYRNRGDGTFDEVGRASGIAQGGSEKGLGAVFVDVDEDGDLDLYVANDGAVNRLYVNDGRGRFEDEGLLSGAGLSALGAPEAGMGIAVGDLDGDSRLDFVVSHFAMETNTLYRNLGERFFEDATATSGLGPPSVRKVGWGLALPDVDNDGDLDLAVANGHIHEEVQRDEPSLQYRQPNLLFENRGGVFHDVSARGGSGFVGERVSRGLAIGDWNDDGRIDVLITNTNDAPNLLENVAETDHHWLGVRLVGPPPNRFAIGARVELRVGERRLVREVRSGGSFLSQSDLRLHFGLGGHTGSVTATVHWPDGRRQVASTKALDRYWTIEWNAAP